MTKTRENKVESLVRVYRLLARLNKANTASAKSDTIYFQSLADHYSRVLKAPEEGRFVAAYGVFCPVEILYAMDIAPVHLEATAWLIALFLGETGDMLTAANSAGLATEICSAHRIMAGAYALHSLPRPDVVLWTNMACENCAKSGGMIAKLAGCPGFFLDHPCEHTPEEEKYLVEELKNLVAFLESRSGRKLNGEKLAEAISHSNRQIALYREIAQLRKNSPSPFPSTTFLKVFMTDFIFAGQPEATAYLEALRDELVDRVRHGKGVVPQERFRLMNMNMPPLHFISSLERIFQEYGAVEVVNPFFLDWKEGTLDTSKPLESMAKKSFMSPLMRIYSALSDDTLDMLKRDAVEYKIDGAINYAHIGCSSLGALSRLFRDTLGEVGVPTLDLPCDIADPTVTSAEEMREKLVRFFELLEDR